MNRHRHEVADVIRKFRGRYEEQHRVDGESGRILRDLVQCRTSALGGHKWSCDHCDHEEISYNSCRNRHCPKCQAQARAQWLQKRTDDLLEVPYFHIVFTLPDAFGSLALHNRRLLYGILFRAASETLLTIGRDEQHLGAEVGFLALLHTWGQKMQLHPHLHCVVAGGGLTKDRSRWVPCHSEKFFLPVRVLSSLFRGKFLAHLKSAHDKGELHLPGQLAALEDPAQWARWIEHRRQQKWIVYAKPPFGGPTQVLKYLARYTHRVAIANSRLVSIDESEVAFRWKDYAHNDRQRTLRLDGVEFLRRFLLHKLPSRFVRIRHYGFLANRGRREKVPCIRALIEAPESWTKHSGGHKLEEPSPLQDRTAPWTCPKCNEGALRKIENFGPESSLSRAPPLWAVPLEKIS